MSRSDRHTKIVKAGRIILPAIAIILIISIFSVTNKTSISDGFIFTDAELRELASGQKITSPKFAGVTQSGDAFTLSAEAALPDAPNPSRIELIKPIAQIETRSALTIESSAKEGEINLTQKSATLRDQVTILVSNGFTASAEIVSINFKTGNVSSDGGVVAKGPLGEISAGSFKATQNLDIHPNGGHAQLEFYSGVKLLYVPSQEETQE